MTNGKRFIGVAEMAKILKKELRHNFPDVKFSVKSDSYSGGSSINVEYTDGVAFDKVDSIARNYAGKGFDGMIDMSYFHYLYLNKDGFLRTHKSEGTTDSMGVSPSYENKLPEGAIMVETSHPYIFTRRNISNEVKMKASKDLAKLMDKKWNGLTENVMEFKGYICNWSQIVRTIVSKKDLTGFKGITRAENTCGECESFYEVVTE